jgi:hypothetical protein
MELLMGLLFFGGNFWGLFVELFGELFNKAHEEL